MNATAYVRRIRTLNMLARTAPDRQMAEVYAARVQLALRHMHRAAVAATKRARIASNAAAGYPYGLNYAG